MNSPTDHAGDARAGLLDFLRRHDASVQVLVAVVAHAYGAEPSEVFLLTRAAVHSAWAELAALDEDARVVEMALTMTRTARSLGGHGTASTDRSRATHRPRPAVPPTPRSVLAARGFDPAWREPVPWRLLAADEARPVRALRHLDPLARDLAVLRWLGVPGDRVAPELDLSMSELPRHLDDAMRQWAAVVAAAASDALVVPAMVSGRRRVAGPDLVVERPEAP